MSAPKNVLGECYVRASPGWKNPHSSQPLGRELWICCQQYIHLSIYQSITIIFRLNLQSSQHISSMNEVSEYFDSWFLWGSLSYCRPNDLNRLITVILRMLQWRLKIVHYPRKFVDKYHSSVCINMSAIARNIIFPCRNKGTQVCPIVRTAVQQ